MFVITYDHHFSSGKKYCKWAANILRFTEPIHTTLLTSHKIKGKIMPVVLLQLFFFLSFSFSFSLSPSLSLFAFFPPFLFIRLFLRTLAKLNLWVVFPGVQRAPLGSLEVSADYPVVFKPAQPRISPVFTVVDGLMLCASCRPIIFNLNIIIWKIEVRGRYAPLVTA